MATKAIHVVTHPNQTQFNGYGTNNGYIGIHPELIPKLVSNTENYYILICHVILFDNYRVIKTTINI